SDIPAFDVDVGTVGSHIAAKIESAVDPKQL
ncbi:MAG: hypothetical protein QMC46_10730, partial [Burkholderiaceae bacterium]